MEARLQLLTAERLTIGRFSFASTPELCRALRAGDESLAGEITQATYLRVLRHIGALSETRPCGTGWRGRRAMWRRICSSIKCAVRAA